MLRKIVVCFVVSSILGYVFGHGFDHAQANLSSHAEGADHHSHGFLTPDHEKLPSEVDHAHLEEFIKMSSHQKSLKNKMISFWSIGDHFKFANTKQLRQSFYFKPGITNSDPLDRVNLSLRI